MDANTLNNGAQVAVDDDPAVQLVAANSSRRGLILSSDDVVYIGTVGVTATTGFLLPADTPLHLHPAPRNAIYAICATAGTANVTVSEIIEA